MDNYFTSIPLFEDLEKNMKIYSCGTVRSNRLTGATAIVDKQFLKTMNRGDYSSQSKNNVIATVWKDNKHIYLMSNAYPPSSDEKVKRKQKDGTVITIQAPPMLAGYNKYMGGVDKSDQMKSYYGLNRKSKRWTLRLIWHFIDIAAVNAYCLYKANLQANLHPPLLPIKPMDSLDFRCSLIDSLVDVFTCRKQTGRPRLPTSPTIAQGSHTLVRCEDIGQPKGRCVSCCLGKKPGDTTRIRKRRGRPRKRKETIHACGTCKVRLCPTPCFDKYHKSSASV